VPVGPMDEPQGEIGVPDYVPDELVAKYGSPPRPAPDEADVPAPPAAASAAPPPAVDGSRARGGAGWVVAAALTVISATLLLIVVTAPSPLVTVGTLLALLLMTVTAVRIVTRPR
jgi:hypothetical protein